MTKKKTRIVGLTVGALMFFGAAAPLMQVRTRTVSAEDNAQTDYTGATYAEVKAAGVEALRETPTSTIASWERYDSRDFGLVTPIQDQRPFGLCWAYGATAAMEATILREGLTDKTTDYDVLYGAGGRVFDYSKNFKLDEYEFIKAASTFSSKYIDPLGMANNDTRPGDLGTDTTVFTGTDTESAGGTIGNIMQILSAWQGVYEMDPQYTDLAVAQASPTLATVDQVGNRPAQVGYAEYRLQNAEYFRGDYYYTEDTDGDGIAEDHFRIDEVKEMIAKYGAVGIEYNAGNLNYNKYWVSENTSADHFSCIIGWVDDIDASNFKAGGTATGNGAWIVKNSWGTGFHGAPDENNVGNGYFYLSFTSKFIAGVIGFDLTKENDEKEDFDYDWNYNFIDNAGSSVLRSLALWRDEEGNGIAKAVNIYEAKNKGIADYNKANNTNQGKEFLAGVMVGVVGRNAEIEVTVHKNVTKNGGDWAAYYWDGANKGQVYDETLFNPVGKTTEEYKGYYLARTSGVYTIPLDGLIELRSGETFSIEVNITRGQIIIDTNSNTETDSYVFTDPSFIYGTWNSGYTGPDNYGPAWRQAGVTNNGTFSIKALTVIGVEEEFTKSLDDCTIEFLDEVHAYNFGEDVEPAFVVKTPDGKIVQEGLYSTRFTSNTEVTSGDEDWAYVTVSGKGLYRKGTSTWARFKISPYDITNDDNFTATFGGGSTPGGLAYEEYLTYDGVIYSGVAYTPEVQLYRNGVSITINNYEWEFENNVEVGQATIIIKGKDNLTGTLVSETLGFTIIQAEQPEFPEEYKKILEIPEHANKLWHIPLPENWEWVEPDTMLTTGQHTFYAIYSDQHNYDAKPIAVNVLVKKVGDGLGFDDNPVQPPVDDVDPVADFVTEVGKIAGATTLSAKLDRIRSASAKWAALSAEEKADESAKTAYATLVSAIEAFNASAEAVNSAHASAIQKAIDAVSNTTASVSILAAAWYVGKSASV